MEVPETITRGEHVFTLYDDGELGYTDGDVDCPLYLVLDRKEFPCIVFNDDDWGIEETEVHNEGELCQVLDDLICNFDVY